MKNIGNILTYVFVISLSAVFCAAAVAQEKAEMSASQPQVKRQVLKKEVVGEVAGIAGNFIAVDHKPEGGVVLEIAIPMDKNTKFSRKSLKELAIGDLVAVSYEETIETQEGQKPRTLKRVAKVVEFRQPSKIKVEEGTGMLQSK